MANTQKRRARQQQGQVNKCVKYSLFFYNFIFWIIGSLLLVFGIWGLVSKKNANLDEITGLVVDPMWMFVILGAVIFVISFAGCIGALRENTCLLKFFCVALGFIVLLEITALILAIVYKTEADSVMGNWIQKAINDYMDDPDIQFLLDNMQSGLRCCGAVDPNDWDSNRYFNCSSPAVSACGVPYSCCVPDEDSDVVNYQCGYGVRRLPEVDWFGLIWIDGCNSAISYWLLQNIIIVSVAIGVILIVQIISIFFVRYMLEDIEMIKALW
ncbi:tetraspanin-17-like [Ptychodera flava]|uniref:tetraspanin-17-like n=1 Tax=Ptychodera flava TaxID=63121 RepID=UPI003969E27F